MDSKFENSQDYHDVSTTVAVDSDSERGNLGEGLKEWTYCSPFNGIELDIDGINTVLGKSFVEEANKVL
ncbi:hypothetical protein BWQ96_09988 [Gracilariopsis chorda]|uniref:Uncharacterized protein n=1 Tax=Gracilariopsis chorda TaxID=448386 RepID=A0A2V3IDZ6_9FLOR|nr:hypothetical protein BWQ96_09988 [Gracilariopsis chorda]|eukprot:PXF40305.1 hypothetical protein BWQ96_09988 [Gracilariopsis chorda]